MDPRRAMSNQWRKQGLCPGCGKEPEERRVHCSEHLRYYRTYQREKRWDRKKRGECLAHGKAKPCPNCDAQRERSAFYDRERRRRWREEGACSSCGGEREDEAYLQCELCLEEKRMRRKQVAS